MSKEIPITKNPKKFKKSPKIPTIPENPPTPKKAQSYKWNEKYVTSKKNANAKSSYHSTLCVNLKW